jgi:hypothetical protein
MITKLFQALIIIWVAITGSHVYAQTTTDSTGLNHAIANYNTAIGQQSHLYNGPEYEYYDPLIKGNAYVLDIKNFSAGSVTYDGFLYSNVPMLYDINAAKVVILLYNNFTKISLLNDRISSFSLLGHHFINITADSLLAGHRGVDIGFYDQLYGGRHVDILVKRSKSIQTNSSMSTIERYFADSKTYYVRKKGDYFSFGGKGSLLSILKDKQKELKQYIKTNKIDFDDNAEQAMTSIVAYYDSIVN